ncbi:hypothetical protein [Nocardia sp. NPDC050412]|uniref:hypothetical protein n=1 Tax=Nocardia sp. NPDC050412 TaxID=3364320 RepID=UPI0037A0286F
MRLPSTVPTWSRAWHGSDLRRELEFWDPEKWQPRVLGHRCWLWITATRRRRWIFWGLVAFFMLFVLPAVLSAVAGAQTDTETVQSSGNGALGFTNMRDSYGVPVSRYTYITSDGSLFHPITTVMAAILGLMCEFFLIAVVLPIWGYDSAVRLGWLDWLRAPLTGAAEGVTAQIATAAVFFFFVTLGAFFVAYFVARGFFAKASFQIATMLVMAIVSALFLRDPLAEILSSHGMLAQGRDVGLSVAAGVNGDSSPNPAALAQTMQQSMVDNFVRHPLQVWNFGHVVDERPACASAWSSGISAGNDSQVKKGLKACGDSVAATAADNPSMGQIGAGLLVLILMLLGIVPFFGYMSIRIVWSGLDAIYWAFMGLFGFAAGGYVYGPTQTFTIRSVVHGFFSFFRMAAEIAFVAVIALIENEMLKQAKGREIAVLFFTAVIMIVAFLQAKRFTGNLDRGNEWIANRFAIAVQNGGTRAGAGSGGGGGYALGMGQIGARHKMGGMGMMALMGGASTIANSPLTEWMMMGLPGSFHPQSRLKRAMTEAQGGVWVGDDRFGGRYGWYAQSYMNRELFASNAGLEAVEYGGLDSVLGNAAAVQGVLDVGGTAADSFGAMIGAGARDEKRARLASRSRATIAQAAGNEPLQDRDLAFLAAALRHTQNSARLLIRGDGSADEVAANFGTLQQAAREFRRVRAGGVALDEDNPLGHPQVDFVREYAGDHSRGIFGDIRDNPDEAAAKMRALNNVINGTVPTTGMTANDRRLQSANVGVREAERMKQWIMNEHARNAQNATEALVRNVADPEAIRNLRDTVYDAVRSEHLGSGRTTDLSNTVTPRGQNDAHPRWVQTLGQVDRLLGN